MNGIRILSLPLLMSLTMCGTAPVTANLIDDRDQFYDDLYEALEDARQYQIQQNQSNPAATINSALAEFLENDYGSNGATEQEELLQLPSSVDRQSSGWRYD